MLSFSIAFAGSSPATDGAADAVVEAAGFAEAAGFEAAAIGFEVWAGVFAGVLVADIVLFVG